MHLEKLSKQTNFASPQRWSNNENQYFKKSLRDSYTDREPLFLIWTA